MERESGRFRFADSRILATQIPVLENRWLNPADSDFEKDEQIPENKMICPSLKKEDERRKLRMVVGSHVIDTSSLPTYSSVMQNIWAIISSIQTSYELLSE